MRIMFSFNQTKPKWVHFWLRLCSKLKGKCSKNNLVETIDNIVAYYNHMDLFYDTFSTIFLYKLNLKLVFWINFYITFLMWGGSPKGHMILWQLNRGEWLHSGYTMVTLLHRTIQVVHTSMGIVCKVAPCGCSNNKHKFSCDWPILRRKSDFANVI